MITGTVTTRCLLLSCFLTFAFLPAASAENWPQWRGPTNDGIRNETHLPAEWSDSKNIIWKLPLPGMGGSTPAIWRDRIFLTSEEGDQVVLLCISTDGKQVWKHSLSTGPKARYMHNEGNLA